MSETLSAEETKFFADYAADKTPVERTSTPENTEQPETERNLHEGEERAPEQRRAETVPHAKFNEEREKRKAAEGREQKLREEMAAVQARLEERMRTMAPPPQIAAPEPTLETDPTGFLRRQAEELSGLRQWRQQQEALARQAAHFQQVIGVIQHQEAEYAKAVPDYMDAAAHLQTSRDAELQLMGVADPLARRQMIQQDVLALAQMAQRAGRSVAEVVYEGAKLRGYTPKQARQAAQQAQEATDPHDPVRTARRGQDFADGLGGAGSAPNPALTVERLMEMDEESFLKAMNTPAARKLMGA